MTLLIMFIMIFYGFYVSLPYVVPVPERTK